MQMPIKLLSIANDSITNKTAGKNIEIFTYQQKL